MSVVAKSTKVYSGFAPTQIPGCALWLDAADPSSLTLSGSSVSSWVDKSGNGRNASQATTSLCPVLQTNQQNGLSAIKWDGVDDRLDGSLSWPTNGQTTLFIAYNLTNVSASQRVFDINGNSYGNFGSPWGASLPYVSDALLWFAGATYPTNAFYTQTASSTGWRIYSVVFNGTSSLMWKNGVSMALSGSGASVTPNGTAYTLGNYANGTSSEMFSGHIGEVIFYSGNLSTTQRQQAEGYLAQKWGLASVMPASHPFGVSIAPSPQSFSPRDIDGCALWLDAADPTTLTLSGSNVSAWRDKSGAGYAAVNNGTNTTARSQVSNINGVNVVSFPTLSQLNISNMSIANQNKSIFYVIRVNGTLSSLTSADRFVMPLNCLTLYGLQTYLAGYGTAPPYYFNCLSVTGISDCVNFATNTNIANTPILLSAVTVSGSNVAALNGTTQTLTANNPPGSFLTAAATYTLGNAIYTTPWDLGEMIIYNTALSPSQREQVEGYLAWKWGLVPNIPSPHPYKLALPYVRQFSPRDVAGCALWLDAADSSTITLSGNNVTQWSDKSGTANNAVPGSFGALGPTRTTSNSLLFTRTTSSTQYLRTQTGRQTTIPATFFLVVKSFNDNSQGVFFDVRKGTGNPLYTLYSTQALVRGTSPNTTNYPYTFPSTLTIVCFRANTNVFQMFINGNQQVNATPTLDMPAADSGWTTIGALADTIGTYSNQILYTASSEMSEIMMYNAFLTDTQRQQIEGYLAWKWNLTSNLPAAHPFEDKPPYAQPFLPTNVPGCSLWLDAADAGSVALSGSNVTQWSDKSGNGRNAVVSSTAFATYSNSGLYFANSLYTTTLSASPTNETLFLVFNNTSTSNTGAIIGAYGGGREIANYDSNRTVGIVKAQIVWGPYANFPAFNAKYMAACIVSPTATKVIVNGGTSITTGSAITFSSSSNTILGREAGVDFGVTGIMHEVISFNSVLSDTQRQQVEGYLAWKWGLTSFLSVGHPFKYNAPSYYIPPFAPTDLAGCALWLDAADSTSLTLSGSSVTAWADKSGNGRNASQATSTRQPVLQSSQQNSLPGIKWDGVDDNLTGSFPYPTNGETTLFVVYNVSVASGNQRVFDINGNGYGNFGSPQSSSSADVIIWQGTGGLWTQRAASTGWRMYSVNYAGTTSAIWRDGVSQALSSTGTLNPTPTGTTYTLGNIADGGNSGQFSGHIGELILYSGNLTTTQRQMVENYLAWKWGLNQSLVARPNVRPLPLYTRPINPLDIVGCAVWLDAFRVNGQTTPSNNSSVSSWVNLAGGSNFTQATSSRQPTFLSNGLATGYPSVYFNSSNTAASIQYLFAGPNVQTTKDASIFYISRYTDVGGGQTQIDFRKDAAGTALRTFKVSDYQIRDSAGNLYTMSYTPTTAPSIKSYRDTLNTSFGYLNGSQVTSSTGTYDQPAADSNGIYLGCHYLAYQLEDFAAVTFSKVYISEVIVYNRYLSIGEQQQVEGYLVWKWGLSSSVATAHPFKRFPSLMTTFAPAQLSGLSLWLDAADPSTITSSGSLVTSWMDKSGNGYSAIATTAYAPSRTTAINGLNALSFAFGKYLLLNNFNQNFSTTTCFFVCKPTEDITPNGKYSNGYPQYWVVVGKLGNYFQTGVGYENPSQTGGSSYFTAYLSKNGTGLMAAEIGPIPYSTYNPVGEVMLVSQVLGGTSGTNSMYKNGSSIVFAANNSGTLPSLSGITLYVGGSDIGQSFGYDLAEVILYNSPLTTVQRQQVEGYLAWKWGLVGNLPSTHPYKKFTP